jgi:hypothetical protein
VQSVLDTPSKLKRNFSANEDVQLLHAVQAEKPWAASYGFISATCEAITGQLTGIFEREVAADAAQKRFNKLPEHFCK